MPVREIYLRALGKDPRTHQMGSGVAPQVKKQLYALQTAGRIVTTSPGLWALAPNRAQVNLLNATGCGDSLEAGPLPNKQEGGMAARRSGACEGERQFEQLQQDGTGTQQCILAGPLTDAAVLEVLQKTSGAGMPVREIYLRAQGKDPSTHQMGSGVAPQVKKQLYALQTAGRIVTTSPGLWALAPNGART